MSATGSMMIRNLRHANDYDKARLNQDELLKIAISNDNNISNARRDYKNGTVPDLLPIQKMTPDELQEDLSKQYSDAITNLLSLGIDYREASEIVARIGGDPDNLYILNNTFPSIKTDFLKRFDPKRVTVTGFTDFFHKYREVFDETKGIADNSTLFNDKFDRIINNINDLRALLPTREQFGHVAQLLARVAHGDPRMDEIIDRVREIQHSIPDENFFRTLAQNSDNTQVFVDIAQLQNAMTNLPSQAELKRQLDLVAQGNEDAIQVLIDLVGGISNVEIYNINSLEQRILGKIEKLGEEIISLTGKTERVIQYSRDGDELILIGKNKIFYREHGYEALQPLDVTKMKKWYKENTHNFKDWYDNVIGDNLTFESVKNYISQNGVLTKVQKQEEESIAPTGDVSGTSRGKGLVRKVGRGISPPKEEMSHIQFGKHLIHLNNLNKGILSLHHKSGGKVINVPSQPISDDFKDYLITVLQKSPHIVKDFSRLNNKEKRLFEKISVGAGIFHKLGLKQSHDDILDRYNILLGEFEAGNNSNELIKELRSIVIRFIDDGRIKKSQGRELLMNIN